MEFFRAQVPFASLNLCSENCPIEIMHISFGNLLPQVVSFNHKKLYSVEGALSEGISPVVVDNTNTQFWEMRPYVIAVSFLNEKLFFWIISFS